MKMTPPKRPLSQGCQVAELVVRRWYKLDQTKCFNAAYSSRWIILKKKVQNPVTDVGNHRYRINHNFFFFVL